MTLPFAAPSGATYELAVEWLDSAGDRRLRATTSAADLRALDEDELFHLSAVARPAELRLDAQWPAILELRTDASDPIDGNASDSAADWLAAHPDRCRTDRWFVTRIAQPDADPAVDAVTLWHYVTAAAPDTDPRQALDEGAQFLREQHPEFAPYLDAGGGIESLFATLLGESNAVDPLPRFYAELVEAGFAPEWTESGDAFAFGVEGDSGRWVCLAETRPSVSGLVLYALLPVDLPQERRPEVYELIGRWNLEQAVSTLDLEPDEGQLLVRTALVVDGMPTTNVLRRLLALNVEAADEALPILERFAAGADVADALAE